MRYPPLPLAERVTVHGTQVETDAPPDGLLTLEDAGLLSVPGVRGQVIYRAPGSLFETRATVTPGGDYLLMLPTDSAGHDPADGHCHYGRADRKVNGLVALRSSDGGESWHGPRVAFDIDYHQHGFVAFIPRGGNRLYMDLFIDRGTIHLFIPHRWQQVTCLPFPEDLLPQLPTAADF